ncbi:MAG: hypothetical protein Q7O12_06055 [Deltaproteobacteria bacterium]|nr:hypothetical protein [Deltaproteobacteria bacterium]
MYVHPCVTFILPFCLHIPDDYYDILHEDDLYRAKTTFIVKSETAHSPMTSAGPWGLGHDTFGRMGNTKLNIIFINKIELPNLSFFTKPDFTEKDLIKYNIWRDKEEDYINIALKVCNRILEVYRDQDKRLDEPSFHIFPVTLADISDARFYLLDEEFKRIFYGGIRPYPKGMMGISGRTPEVIKIIKEMLVSNTQVPFWRVLIRNAQNYLWRENYRLVPVEMNTAFEFVINETLNKYIIMYLYKQKPTTFLDKLILLQFFINDYRSIMGNKPIEWAPQSNQGGWRSLPSVSGRQEVVNWYLNCYLLRNKVIHEGYNNVTRVEAEQALNSTESAITFIFELAKI